MSTLLTRLEQQPAPSKLSGRNIVCWGSAGSGKSVIALNLACELADLGQRVLLVDADSYHPSLAALMGIVEPGPGITAALRLIRAGRLNTAELERLGHRIEVGNSELLLLSGMNNPARWPELDAQALTDMSEFAKAEFDCVIWDVASLLEENVAAGSRGDERNAATITLVGLADQVLALFLADPVGINRFLFDFRLLRRDCTPVANRVRAAVLGRQPERQLRDVLFRLAKLKLEHEIVEDSGFDELLRNVRPLMLQTGRSKAREAIRRLGEELLDM